MKKFLIYIRVFLMKRIYKSFKNILDKYIGASVYKKNIMIMVGGRIIAQSIPILLTPLLTRIYSPVEFGTFAVFSAIVSFIAMISNARYCVAIILPKKEQNAQKLVSISSIFTISVSVIFGLFLIFYGKPFFELLSASILNKYLIIVVSSILFVGLYEPLFYYGLREKIYKGLASNVIWQALTLISVRLLLGYLGYTESGLMISYLISYIVSFILLSFRLKISIRQHILNLDSNLKSLLKRYINFPKFSLFGDSLSVLSSTAPNLLLNSIFGSAATGYFNLSDKVLGSPIWFVTSSVGDVFKQEASEQYRSVGSCEKVFMKTTRSLIKIGIIPFLIIFFAVPPLVPFIFGANWAPAGEYIRIFSIMYFSSFIVNPTSYIIFIVGKQKYGIFFQIIKLVGIASSFGLGFYFESLTLALVLWSGSVTLTNLIIYFFSYKFAKDSKNVESLEETN